MISVAERGSFNFYPPLELQLPSSEFNEVSDDTPSVVVSIEATGDLYINRNMVEEATFREAVVAVLDEQEDRTVFLNADKTVPYERVLTVIRMVSEAGGEQINFLYQSEE